MVQKPVMALGFPVPPQCLFKYWNSWGGGIWKGTRRKQACLIPPYFGPLSDLGLWDIFKPHHRALTRQGNIQVRPIWLLYWSISWMLQIILLERRPWTIFTNSCCSSLWTAFLSIRHFKDVHLFWTSPRVLKHWFSLSTWAGASL